MAATRRVEDGAAHPRLNPRPDPVDRDRGEDMERTEIAKHRDFPAL